MAAEERRRDFELRQEARERDKGEWVVFQGELKHISDSPQDKDLRNL